jgi:hypothetical protein
MVIINILYVSIAISRNKLKAMWPLRILQSVVGFIVTVLFNPIMGNILINIELLLSVYSCTDDPIQGWTNTFFDMVCWEGTFFIHAGVGLIAVIVFNAICFFVSFNFYSTNPADGVLAKTSSKADFFNLVVKTLNPIFNTFLIDEKYLMELVPCFFILAVIQFYFYYTEMPYFINEMNTIYLLYIGIYLWSCTICVIALLCQNYGIVYDSGIQLFVLALPVIIIIIMTIKDDKKSLLIDSITNFTNGESVEKTTRYFLELIDKKDIDRQSQLILNGYIYMYNEANNNPNHPLSAFKIDQQDFENRKNSLNDSSSVAILYQHANLMYQLGISKFPTCVFLRTSYAIFLRERLKNKKQCLIELANAEKYKPQFDQQFLLYRYRKIVLDTPDEKEEAQIESNLDVVATMAYNNYFNQCIFIIK